MQPDTVFHFSTDDLPAKDRLAVWREVMGRQHMRLDIEPSEPSTLWATAEVHRLPFAQISFIQSSPATYTRTRELMQDGNGDFTFIRIESAGFRVLGDRIVEEIGPRDGALLFHGRAGVFDVLERTRVSATRMNGAIVRDAVRGLDERLVHHLRTENPALRLLDGYIGMISRSGVPDDPALAYLVNTHLIDLLALGLRPTGETRERALGGAIQAARLAAIRADVLANLAETRMSARTIARRQGVSERYVYLLFEQNGLSFSRFVMEERLKRTLMMLVDPSCDTMRISEIAFAVGFGDLTTFNRAFRRRYGDTPRALRQGRNDAGL